MTKTLKTMIKIKTKKLTESAVMPCQMSDGAAAFDLCVDEACAIYPQRSMTAAYKVSTGLSFEIPKGYYMLILLRSSTGANTKLRLANGVGLIDDDYRGEVKIILENIGNSIYYLQKGERLAQCLILKKEDIQFVEASNLSKTKRGVKGIGSTGRKGSKRNERK